VSEEARLGELAERLRAYRTLVRDLIATLGSGRGACCERRLRRAALAARAALVDREDAAWGRCWRAVRAVVLHAAAGAENAALMRLERFLSENADLAPA